MSNPIIKVNNLSKRYRIGAKEQGYKTFREAIVEGISAPIRNLAKLRRLTEFKDNPSSNDEEDVIWALKDVSFEVNEGEVLGIIGRNGAGKTTILKVLSRITEPTSGSAEIHGRVSSLLEVGTGFHPELTGRENIFLNGAVLGMRKREIKEKFNEIVSFSGIEKFIDTPVKRYSSGMYVRLAFAVAAHLEPEILLIDEVLAVGDVQFQKKCLGKMKDVASGGRTVLFVSHNMQSINSLCNRAILLENGRIAYSGSTMETINKYLKEGKNRKNEKLEWIAPEKELPFSDVVKIKRYYIQDEEGNIPNGQLFNSKKYNVVIEVDLKQKDPRLIFMVGYYDKNNTLIFVTDIHDTGDFDIKKLKTGEIKLSVPVPVDIFYNGVYLIELLCCLHYTGWILPPGNESKIEFEFLRNINLNPYPHDIRLGLIAPVLKWKIL